MPKVTVVIPNYNHARFLKQRIDSVLNQTYQDFELLYLDDASTDNSDEMFRQCENHPKIRVIKNSQNSGSPFKQWNKGVREAKGEYIWLAEADDYADHKLLEVLVEKLEQNENVGVAYSKSWRVDEEGTLLSTTDWWTDDLHPSHWHSDFISAGKDECAQYLSIKNTIPNASAVVFKKSVYGKVGYADETMRLCGDWLLWAKVLMVSDLAFVAEPLNYFRMHSRSVTGKSTADGTDVEEHYRVCNFILSHIDASPSVIKRICSNLRYKWRSSILSGNGKVSWKSNRKIYHYARRIDPEIYQWLLKTAVLWVLYALRRFAGRYKRRLMGLYKKA